MEDDARRLVSAIEKKPRNRQSSRGFSIQIFSIKVLSTRAEFNPVGVGFLTDKYQRDTSEHEEGSRFDPARAQGADYRRRYWNNTYFDALDVVRPVAAKLGISTAEAALRWVRYHSQLRGEHGDAIIIGASSAGQLEKNLTSLENGPLPDEMIKALDEGWAIVKAVTKPYFT
ncbi:Aldo/keto reductase [Coniochaeta ligniaria NRRL 30616]|uniref:Aldo/keto reductase n=1 Tax=Coniochaeta ligniaria NRRL 30616 TaxID=1408157 RepID=A0A1J7ISS3_9PEZI|nr:Aldo/keto reductase [Coniochaeta ligniaria NRRL 30616]